MVKRRQGARAARAGTVTLSVVILETQQRLAGAVRDAVRTAFDLDLPDVSFQYPPRVDLGDLALTAPFDLAKTLRRKPREIAERMAGDLGRAPGVRRADVAGGGYVNLFLDRGAFAGELAAALTERRKAPARPGHVIVEHTSINPNKAAHIGHLRNACLGDTFVRLCATAGTTWASRTTSTTRASRWRTWS